MEDYGTKGGASAEEKQAYQKLYRAAAEKKLSTGSVHLYVFTPDGEPVDSIHVAHAKPEKVIATLRAAVEKLGVPEGKPLVEPRPQSKPPAAEPGSLVLHLTARAVPGKAAGFWQELPGEDWIVFAREQASKFLPPAGAIEGAAWDVDRGVALQLLNHFYPSTENNDVGKNEVEEMSMKATLVAPGRVRLDATLRMKHPFYHRKDDARVEASAAGLVEFGDSGILKFRMATDKATYNGGTFGVAVREAR